MILTYISCKKTKKMFIILVSKEYICILIFYQDINIIYDTVLPPGCRFLFLRSMKFDINLNYFIFQK